MEMRDLILSHIHEGVILTDPQGMISYMNPKSEQILGLRHQHYYTHDAGVLEPGDYILIVDSALGVDDGGLKASDLHVIGCHEVYHTNDGLLLWAQYMTDDCQYKMIPHEKKRETATLIHHDLPFYNRATLDFKSQTIDIYIQDMHFHKSYKMAYGYLIILSSQGKLKFFQEDGYSIRKESIRDILSGKSYREKRAGQVMSLIGENISACFVDYHKLDQGESYLINGIPVVISQNDIFYDQNLHRLYLLEDVTALNLQKKLREEALQSLEKLKGLMSGESKSFGRFQGVSDCIRETIRSAQKASLVDSNMLITGESGTGKSLLAKEIHHASARREGPFVSINCSSIPEALFESEMYGYSRGAFTGANISGKLGYFEAANGGTLFLDEISELSLVNQAKLLHAIQEQRISRLGSTAVIQLNLRIIVATNKDLMEEVHNRLFREDLYYRLNVISLVIPPLRYRPEDIRFLAEYKFKDLSKKFPNQSTRDVEAFIQYLMVQPLFGNARELENRVERYLAMGEEQIVDQSPQVPRIIAESYGTYAVELEAFEARLILQTLAAHDHHVRKTYEALGMKRSTFYDRIKKLRLDIPKK